MAIDILIDTYEAATTANVNAEDFLYGRLSDVNLLKTKTFPVILGVADEGTVEYDPNRTTYDVTVYCIDTYKDAEQSTVSRRTKFGDVQAVAKQIWDASQNHPAHYIDKRVKIKADFIDKAFNGLYVIASYNGAVVVGDCL